MSWAISSTPTQNPKYIIAHTDLDGIARAAAAKRIWRDARILIRYSRTHPSTMPNTLAEALRTWISQAVPTGSEVLFIDIPVDVTKPSEYVEALRIFCHDRKCIWTDHHETDAPFLKTLSEISTALWFGPSAYEYTLALVQWLGGDPREVENYAILTGFGDRDPHVIRVLRSRSEDISRWQKISDGMDVLIRQRSSSSDPADYEPLVSWMADNLTSVLAEAERLADQIPTPRDIVTIGTRVVLVREQLNPMWGPKSLERAALRAGTLYAVGVSQNPRDRTYAVRAITYWVALAEQPDAIEVGRLQAFQRFLQEEGRRAFGPPAAPVVPRYATFDEALRAAERLANIIAQSFYEPQTTLINDRYVARAIATDFANIMQKLTEILETQKRMYEEYLELKRRQVELLERTQRHEYD